MSDGMETLLLVVALYFLPWLIAMVRYHHNRDAIGILNLFLGWTLLGWVAALVWAATETRRQQEARWRKQS